jgi:hypothetical protein
LRDHYRPIVAAGVSAGRFYGIMSQLTKALHEAHTWARDESINALFTYPGGWYWWPTVKAPLALWGGWGSSTAGMGVAPMPDSSLFVYHAQPGNPLGMQAGDILLGYDGMRWVDILHLIDSVEMPMAAFYSIVGSSNEAYAYSRLNAAPVNWYMFDTMDVVRYATGDTVHLSTQPLADAPMFWDSLYNLDALPVPGVPMPDPYQNRFCSWGVIDGTTIGYIYMQNWGPDLAGCFSEAVAALMNTTTGLILDFRLNYGGDPAAANGGYSYLFNENMDTNYDIAHRSSTSDHFAYSHEACSDWYGLGPFNPTPDLYDHPIAVLTGPGCLSAGDYNAFRLRFHPMVRSFGKPTNTAYVDGNYVEGGLVKSPWSQRMPRGSGYSLLEGEGFLIHKGFPVDEEVWLNREDAANGIDAVVKRAVQWIDSAAYAHDLNADRVYYAPGADTVLIRGNVENPHSHPMTVKALVKVGGVILDSAYLYDDGLHGDSLAGDGVWGVQWKAPDVEEYYDIDVSAINNLTNVKFTLPKVARITTAGPIEVDSVVTKRLAAAGYVRVRLWLKNHGADSTVPVIRAILQTTDTIVTSFSVNNGFFGSLAPGQRNATPAEYVFRVDTSIKSADIHFAAITNTNGVVYWEPEFIAELRVAPLVSRSSMTFGEVPGGESRTDSVIIRNPNTLPLNITFAGVDLPSVFDVSPLAAVIAPLDSLKFYVTFHPIAYGNYQGHVTFLHDGDGSSSVVEVSGAYTAPSVEFQVGDGWNLLSVPMEMADYAKNAVYPGSSSAAFHYEGGYHTHATLGPGEGYWLKYGSAAVLEIPGTAIDGDTIPVTRGWNLVGSISYPVPVSSIGSLPGGIVTTGFYGYAGGPDYLLSDTIRPGYGYWVKTGSAGSLVLISSSNIPPKNRIRIEPASELPPPPPDGSPVAEDQPVPKEYALEQNYPNPFNPVTSINFALPHAGYVTLSVYNMLGQEVAVPVNGVQEAGFKSVSFDASRLPSGVYTYRMTAGTFTSLRKMVLLK